MPGALTANGAGPRVAIFGAGSVGSLVAARLAAAGRGVTVVARGRRLEDVRAHGLRVRDPQGVVLRVPVAACAAAEAGRQDIVFLALKGGDIPAALPDIERLVGPETLIVPLVNGIPWWYRLPGDRRPIRAVDPDGKLTAAFDPARIVGAVLFLACALGADGVVTVQGVERIAMGPVAEEGLSALAPLAALFEGNRIETDFVPDIRADLWAKVAMNLATNPLSVVAGATLREQYHSDRLLPAVEIALGETVALARLYGVEPRLSVEQMVGFGRRLGPFYTSMAQDFAQGRPLELGAIGYSVFELAEEVGHAMPIARTLFDLCRFRADMQGATTDETKRGTRAA